MKIISGTQNDWKEGNSFPDYADYPHFYLVSAVLLENLALGLIWPLDLSTIMLFLSQELHFQKKPNNQVFRVNYKQFKITAPDYKMFGAVLCLDGEAYL